MKILVINAGSSSLKYQLIDMTDESVVAKGLCERITMDSSVLTQKVAGKDKLVIESPMPTHKEAMELVLKALLDEKNGAIKSVKEIGAVGHRVLHSGEDFKCSVVVDDDVIAKCKKILTLDLCICPAIFPASRRAGKLWTFPWCSFSTRLSTRRCRRRRLCTAFLTKSTTNIR